MNDTSTLSSKLHRPLLAARHEARAAAMRLVWLVALTAAAVAGTTFLNRAFERMQVRTARTWYLRGVAALQAGKAEESVQDLQAALAHDRDNPEYVRRLAQALAAAGHTAQAKAYFLNLWQAQPGDGELNRELARIAVREHSPAEAEQYYHGAIFGVWDKNPMENRRAARLEVVEFLLAQKQTEDAQAELIALAAETPADAGQQKQIGRLFRRAGNAQRALQEFEQAVRLQPRDASAYAAAGETAFEVGDFVRARSYLERAVRLAPEDEPSRELLARVAEIESINPYLPRLRYADRLARSMRAFTLAGQRLQSCAEANSVELNTAGNSPLQADAAQWRRLKPSITAHSLRSNPDLADTAANLAMTIELDTAAACGRPTGEDLALLTIARSERRR